MSVRGQVTSKHEPKSCKSCGVWFYKPSKLTRVAWEKREFCSNACRGVDIRRDARVDADGRVRIWHDGRLRWRYHVVMERKIGRSLRPGEVVDHINGDPTDDRPENLRLFASHADHMKAHWAEGTIRRGANPRGGSEVSRADNAASAEWPATPQPHVVAA